MKQLMITAMASGEGKTLVTCGLLALAKRHQISVDSRKCGPDYIDPMFHRKVLGLPADNLDSFLMGEERVHENLSLQTAELRLIEGAMGYYDGIGGESSCSAWEMAKREQIPSILVVRPRGNSVTLAAQIQGILNFRQPSMIRGIILNNCKKSLYLHLKPILERELSIPVVGYLPHMEEAGIESRHLGLVTADEIDSLCERLESVAKQMEETVDLAALMKLAKEIENPEESERPNKIKYKENSVENNYKESPEEIIYKEIPNEIANNKCCTIAIARDEAFCFYYESSLRALERFGAKLCYFSPLHDRELPEADAIILGGGYPELYARELSENKSIRTEIQIAIQRGMPALAECGGFLYLLEELEDREGQKWPMAAAFPGKAFRTGGLVRFGYCELTAEEDSMLFRKDEKVPAHEFHYWNATVCGDALLAEKPLIPSADRKTRKSWKCGYATENLYAGFPHLHLDGELPLGERFVEAACKYKKSREAKEAEDQETEDQETRKVITPNNYYAINFAALSDSEELFQKKIKAKDNSDSEELLQEKIEAKFISDSEKLFQEKIDIKTHSNTEELVQENIRSDSSLDTEKILHEKLQAISPLDFEAMQRAQKKWDSLAKPLGSLGELEAFIIQIAGICGSEEINFKQRELIILCADNGVVAQGVSQSGPDVTAAVARALLEGTSTANILAAEVQCRILTIDIGMAKPLCERAFNRNSCIRRGTEDITHLPAMSREECIRAILLGIDLVRERKEAGVNLLLTGEMGIGNTTTSTAVTSVLLKQEPAALTGRGAGLSDEGLKRKIRAIETAISVNQPDPDDVVDVLSKVGGLDLAGLCGICLGGAIYRVPILLDGLITLAAALCAVRLSPNCREFLLPSHLPSEPAGIALIKKLGIHPPINAGLHLGEGTGALFALPLFDQALALYRSGHSFQHLGIEPYKKLS